MKNHELIWEKRGLMRRIHNEKLTCVSCLKGGDIIEALRVNLWKTLMLGGFLQAPFNSYALFVQAKISMAFKASPPMLSPTPHNTKQTSAHPITKIKQKFTTKKQKRTPYRTYPFHNSDLF